MSPSIVRLLKFRGLRWVMHKTRMDTKNAIKILVGKPLGKCWLQRPRRRWKITSTCFFRRQVVITGGGSS